MGRAYLSIEAVDVSASSDSHLFGLLAQKLPFAIDLRKRRPGRIRSGICVHRRWRFAGFDADYSKSVYPLPQEPPPQNQSGDHTSHHDLIKERSRFVHEFVAIQ